MKRIIIMEGTRHNGLRERKMSMPTRPALTPPATVPVARPRNVIVWPFALGPETGIDRDLLKATGDGQSVWGNIVHGCNQVERGPAGQPLWRKREMPAAQQSSRGVALQGELTAGDDIVVEDDLAALPFDIVVSLLGLPDLCACRCDDSHGVSFASYFEVQKAHRSNVDDDNNSPLASRVSSLHRIILVYPR